MILVETSRNAAETHVLPMVEPTEICFNAPHQDETKRRYSALGASGERPRTRFEIAGRRRW